MLGHSSQLPALPKGYKLRRVWIPDYGTDTLFDERGYIDPSGMLTDVEAGCWRYNWISGEGEMYP